MNGMFWHGAAVAKKHGICRTGGCYVSESRINLAIFAQISLHQIRLLMKIRVLLIISEYMI